jgi:methionyl-tRNA formyltransferase
MPLRILFFGTPAFAASSLAHLLDSGHQVVGVVTQPDRARGRGHKITPEAVKSLAMSRGLPVLQPERLKEAAFLHAIAGLAADLGVVAAYGRILPPAVLGVARLGLINVHASLLPRWRGAAPIHRAILAGDTRTGVTIMRVVQALDAGPVLASTTTPIGPDETSRELELRLAEIGARLLTATVDRLSEGAVAETPQDEAGVTYAARLERRESQVDWARPAGEVHNRIRGLHPWPLAAAMLGGKRVLLLRSVIGPEHAVDAPPGAIVAAGGDAIDVAARPGLVRLLTVQPEGRGPMDVRDFLNGTRIAPGDRLGPITGLDS